MIVDEIKDSREVNLSDIFVGQAFMIPSIKGYFMKINKSKNIMNPKLAYYEALGVNIETGEVSQFNEEIKVIPVSVKCNVSIE